MKIDEYSTMSVYAEMYIEGASKPIGIGTAFTIELEEQNYLITNWHIVTGRNPDTNKPLSGACDPDLIKIWFFTSKVGFWNPKTLRLRGDDGEKLWIEHPTGRNVDVVAIPFIPSDDIYVKNLDLTTSEIPIRMYPSRNVSIIGYPNGLSAGGKFPIWKKGHIASEVDLNYNNRPVFLIDATTRSGMSGSPVIFRDSGMVEMETTIKAGRFTKFLGIYSGRIDKTSEIGRVWKPHTINEIVNNADLKLLPGQKT